MALKSKKNNRKCIVCNCSYYFCNHCQDGEIKPSWYTIFHDQNCHDIYDAVANIYPVQGKEAAKQALDKLDLSNKENFHPNIIKLINEIYDIVEESVVQDDVEIKIEDKENETNKVNEIKEVNEENTTKTVSSLTDSEKEINEEINNEETNVANKTATTKKVQGKIRSKK